MKDKKITSIIWGIILVAVGVMIALDAFQIVNVNLFFDGWWTVFIIVPCAVGIFTKKDKSGNIIGLLIGVALLLCCQNVWDFDMLWKLLLPAIIVICGIKMLFKGLKKSENVKIIEEINENSSEFHSACAVFSGADMRLNGELFKGAELTAVFGGVDCDLRNAVFEKDCVINATAVFGGIDIILPENVNVKVSSNSLFGGISDKKHKNKEENTVTVYVNGTSMFGGIEIK